MTTQSGLTIFSAPKPFLDSHIRTIQLNALRSWLQFGPVVELLLVGDEPGIREAARELEVRQLTQVERNTEGTPLISSVFALAEAEARHAQLAYLNADILLLSDFLPAFQQVAQSFKRYLIVGQRWDLDIRERIEFTGSWESQLRLKLERDGMLHPAAGSDYFVFPKRLFTDLPRFALGRAGWDNWMIYAGRRLAIPVVDATAAITAIHQRHDYAHLTGGLPHYRLPESEENVRLGGGRRTIFTLADATWRLDEKGLRKRPWPAPGLLRWIEAGLVSRLGPGRPLSMLWALLHPGSSAHRLMSLVRVWADRTVEALLQDR